MSVNCYLDFGARRIAARHSDGASDSLSAPNSLAETLSS